MFRHIVLFRWTDDATVEQQREAVEGIRALASTIDAIRAVHVGVDARVSDGNFDAAAVVDFDDADGYARYAQHPDHLALIAARIRPIVAQRVAVQHELDA